MNPNDFCDSKLISHGTASLAGHPLLILPFPPPIMARKDSIVYLLLLFHLIAPQHCIHLVFSLIQTCAISPKPFRSKRYRLLAKVITIILNQTPAQRPAASIDDRSKFGRYRASNNLPQSCTLTPLAMSLCYCYPIRCPHTITSALHFDLNSDGNETISSCF